MIKEDSPELAPLDIEKLPDFWDARRVRLGKPDKSTCAAELRLALETSRKQMEAPNG